MSLSPAMRNRRYAILGDLQHNRCIHCRGRMKQHGRDHDQAATLEHFWPQWLGGSDDLANLAMACRRCNEKRGSSLPDDAHYLAQGLLILKLIDHGYYKPLPVEFAA